MTECSKCGNCCDPVNIGWHPEGDKIKYYLPLPDPRSDAGWKKWGRTKQSRRSAIKGWLTAKFVSKNWHVIDGPEDVNDPEGSWKATCDYFDKNTRLCTAHDDRPPICSDYPWYGQAPTRELADRNINNICSFMADVRTVLPIVEVTHGRVAHSIQPNT